MLEMTYEELHAFFAEQRQVRCLEDDEDIVNVVTGKERSGKSTLCVALSDIDPNFNLSQIYFFWKDYRAANQACIKYKIKHMMTEDEIRTFATQFQLNPDEILKNDEIGELDIQPGSCMTYDEAATQMFNRAASSTQNQQQVKLFISNGFLSLIHWMCLPKIRNLDIYIRNERLRFFIWVDKQRNIETRVPVRIAYLWSQDSYIDMCKNYDWQKILNNISDKTIGILSPDIKCVLPDLKRHIGKELWDNYTKKKLMYNLKQTMDMAATEQKAEQKDKSKNYADRKPRDGEDCWTWSSRTGLSPTSFDYWNKISL